MTEDRSLMIEFALAVGRSHINEKRKTAKVKNEE